ncbi:MAG: type IV pilus secretin PilQ [Myxococcota bacterium]|nr:type IV pilus secretin PilQ [Myxococcota bacterium]
MRQTLKRTSLIVALIAAGVAGPVLAEELALQEVEITQDDQAAELIIMLNKLTEGAAVSAFRSSDNRQLTIDIADALVEPDLGSVGNDGNLIEKVEVESVEDNLGSLARVRLSLAAESDFTFDVQGDRVVVRLSRNGGTPVSAEEDESSADPLASISSEPTTDRPPSGPDDIRDGAALSSLDFVNGEDVSRVVIGLKGTTTYQDSRPRSNTIIVDVPGAFVPQSLTRVLDASQFISPVRMVRAYRNSSGARIIITLRSTAEYSITTGEDMLYVDIPVPASMKDDRQSAIESAATVSPSGGSEGIESSYRDEVLIGSNGRTVNPQAAFGSGSGANDPSALAGGFMIDSTSATDVPYSGRQISLDFVNADIHSIFRLISSVSRLNIVAGDDVNGTVTVRMENVPWDQALAAILQAKGLASQRFGNIVRVAPLETIKTEQQMALEAKRAKDELEELQLLVLPLNYSTADELKSQIASLITQRGSLEVDERGNQLIVKETEGILAQIRELVRQLDQQTPQVLIEARIVEASSNFTKGLGIEWGSELDASTSTGYSTGMFFPNSIGASGGLDRTGDPIFYTQDQESLLVDLGPDGATSGVAFSLGSIPGLIDLDARLLALESTGFGKVVSSPKLTTLDNETATVSQGARIPFLSTSAGGTQVQFITAALDLQVTPHITSDNKVFLDVTISNNRADFSQLIQGNPAIQIKEVATQVLVADGDTTVLGGVFSLEESFSQGRVPGLHKIPLLGYLFKNSNESRIRNELLVFITPHIIGRTVADNQ